MAQAIVSPENLELAVEEIKEYIDGKVDSGKSNNIKLRFKSRPILVGEQDFEVDAENLNIPKNSCRYFSNPIYYYPKTMQYVVSSERGNPETEDWFETGSPDLIIPFERNLEGEGEELGPFLYIKIYMPGADLNFVKNNMTISLFDENDVEIDEMVFGDQGISCHMEMVDEEGELYLELNMPHDRIDENTKKVQFHFPELYFETPDEDAPFQFVSDSNLFIADESGYINTHKDCYIYIERWNSSKKRWSAFMKNYISPIQIRDLEDVSQNKYPNEYKYYKLPYTALDFISTLKPIYNVSNLLLRIGIADSFENNVLINKSEPICVKVRGEIKDAPFDKGGVHYIETKVNQIRFTSLTNLLK